MHRDAVLLEKIFNGDTLLMLQREKKRKRSVQPGGLVEYKVTFH